MKIDTSLPAKSISYGKSRLATDIRYIVIHSTGNQTDTARANANYFSKNGDNTRSAGAHYFVDRTSIYQSIDDHMIAYAVGGNKYANTSGGTMHGKITNANSLSIEMCSNGGEIAPETLKNTIELTKFLMARYGIDENHIYRHYDVTGKSCPYNAGWIGSNHKKWDEFKNSLITVDTLEVGDYATVLIDQIKVMNGSGKEKELIGYLNKGARIKILKLNTSGSMCKIAEGVWIYTKNIKKL